MEHLPLYISFLFVLTTLLTGALLSKAANFSKPLIFLLLAWLILQGVIGLSGFYQTEKGVPPRFALLLFPPLLLIICMFLFPQGRKFTDSLDSKTLTILHVVRIPVEITLYWLYLYHTVPVIMTFEGRNPDILCGLTAPLIYAFGYIRKVMGRNVLLAWNIICLALLINIVVTAVLSAPLPFQRFGFEQPNIALLYFPYIWLPAFIVPTVLFSHLASIRKLLIEK